MKLYFCFFLAYAMALCSADRPYDVGFWTGKDDIRIVDCRMHANVGRMLGVIQMGDPQANEALDKSNDSYSHFDPLNVWDHMKCKLPTVLDGLMQKNCPIDANFCLAALKEYQQQYHDAAQRRLRAETIRAMRLAFFVGNTCSIVYTSRNQGDTYFPPIQRVEFFPDLGLLQDKALMFSAEAVESKGKDVSIFEILYPEMSSSVVALSSLDKTIKVDFNEIDVAIVHAQNDEISTKALVIAIKTLLEKQKAQEVYQEQSCCLLS